MEVIMDSPTFHSKSLFSYEGDYYTINEDRVEFTDEQIEEIAEKHQNVNEVATRILQAYRDSFKH